MADLSGLRASIEDIASKISTLRDVIAAIQEDGTVQTAIDDLTTRVDEIGAELDALIEENSAPATEAPAAETPAEETPPA